MRWHTKPITQLVVMFVVMSMVIGAQSTASSFLASNTNNKPVTYENTDLRKVAGGCSYRAGGAIQTGQTETNPQNANPRWPISDPHYRGEYDVLNTQYFTQQANNDARYRGYIDDGPAPEGNVIGMLGSMFGYKPNQFTAAYDMKYVDPYGQGIRGNDPSEIKGLYPILQIPVPANKEVLMASTGYDIGGGEAMVVFASADRVVLHIGRHEYFVGTGQCLLGPCSGGYWIYLSDVCVNDNIVDSYNSVKAAQEAAGPNLNPIQLPVVPAGYPLGKSRGTTVKLALRDNGPFILMNKPGLWQGYPEQNFGTPTNTPPAGGSPTAVPTSPPAGTPTTAPTAPPAGPTPGVSGCFYMSADVQNWQEGGKAKFNVSAKFNSAGGDGDIMLEKNDTLVAGWNGWNRNTNNPYVYGPEWTGGAIEVDPGQSVPVKFTGHVANSVACPGVRANMNCTFNGDGACSCGGTSCQAFATPTPTGGPTLPVTPPPNATATPTLPPNTTATPTTAPGTPTPTQPAGGAPSPTIVVGANRLALIFAGSCDSNPLCGHLKVLTHRDFNSLDGLIWINGAMSVGDFTLGENIVYSVSVGSTTEHRFILTMHANLPPLSSWQDATMHLPGAAGSTYPTTQIYVIK